MKFIYPQVALCILPIFSSPDVFRTHAWLDAVLPLSNKPQISGNCIRSGSKEFRRYKNVYVCIGSGPRDHSIHLWVWFGRGWGTEYNKNQRQLLCVGSPSPKKKKEDPKLGKFYLDFSIPKKNKTRGWWIVRVSTCYCKLFSYVNVKYT